MWFGTIGGLSRYDGLSFTIYSHNVDQPQSLSHNMISCLYEDKEGSIWIGTEGGGLNRKEAGISHFQRFGHKANNPQSLISNTVSGISQDRRGNLWVGTDQGLDFLAAGSEKFIHYQPQPEDPGSIAGRTINFVVTDREGRVWIGFGELGVDCYTPETGRFIHYRHDQKNDRTLASDQVTSAFPAPDGMIWIGHANRWISRLDPQTGLVKRTDLGRDAEKITGLCTDKGGNIWIASSNGLYFLNVATGETTAFRSNLQYPSTLGSNGLLSIYYDETDILWIGTETAGVSKANLNAKRFINYVRDPSNPNTLGFDFVRGIYENRDGGLYIGGFKGFDHLDRKSGIWRHFYQEGRDSIPQIASSAFTICPNSDDERDFLWIGTDGDGLLIFDQIRQIVQPYFIPGLSSRKIFSLFKEKEDILWIGTDLGLNRYDQKKKAVVFYDLGKIAGLDSVSAAALNVYFIFRDRQNFLWVGSRNHGLFSLDPQTGEWRYFSHDPENPRSLSSNMITSILETQTGEMWMGTYGGGLNRMDRNKGTFEHFTTSQGLPNDVVYGILEDGHGQLWISTNFGICRFDPRSGVFRGYTDQDGLIGNEFNSQSFHKSRWTGEFFFGGPTGVTAFFPDEIRDDSHPPSVVLEDLKIFNRSVIPGPHSILRKPISETDSLTLSYRDSMLTFEFNGLHYVTPSKNRFAYILEGFDQQWNMTDAQRRYATYTNLNPGHYTLRVKAANCDGVWNETAKSLKIYIAPPFWKTWWFILLSLMAIIGLLSAGFQYRVRGLKKRKTELENIVALRTQELKEMSLSDPLTNLRNRRYVSEVVLDEMNVYMEQRQFVIKYGQRRKTTLPHSVVGLLLIDIDHFKNINDRFGHKAGDLFISEFASVLRKNVRRDDVVVRWGGEEFLLILKNCDPSFLTTVAEKVRQAVEGHAFLLSDSEELRVNSSCCVGLVGFPFSENVPDLISFDQAIMLADMAMYLGKESGRNRTVYLTHSGLAPEKENVQKYIHSLEALKESGFVKIQVFTTSNKQTA